MAKKITLRRKKKSQMDTDIENQSVQGNSSEAIRNPHLSPAVTKEKSLEHLTSLLSTVAKGGTDFKPFVIASKDGQIIVEECIVNEEDGTFTLPEIHINTQADIDRKSKFVRKILKVINPVLKAEIENVTYVALMRKDQKKLEKMMRAVRTGTKPKLENRVGCIWLIVGDFECVI